MLNLILGKQDSPAKSVPDRFVQSRSWVHFFQTHCNESERGKASFFYIISDGGGDGYHVFSCAEVDLLDISPLKSWRTIEDNGML